jgi:hypothetical protein
MITGSRRTPVPIFLLLLLIFGALPSPLFAQLPDPAQSSVVAFVTDTTVTWIWAAVPGANHYSIWCRDPDGTYGIQWFKCDQTSVPTYGVTGLLPGTSVERKVSTDDNSAFTVAGTILTGQTTNTGEGGGGGGSVGDFRMAITPASATVAAGNAASYSMTTTPTAGFARKLGFTCSGPAATACIVAPSSAMLDGRTPIVLTVTVSTQGRAVLRPNPLARPTLFALIAAQLSFGLAIVMVVRSRRSRHRKALLISALLLILAVLGTCGRGGYNQSPSPPQSKSGTQAGTYTVMITGSTTDTLVPPLSHSVTATLVVQ